MDDARRGVLQERLEDCRRGNRSLLGALRVGEGAAALERAEAVSTSIEFVATRKAQQRAETRVTEVNSELRKTRFSGDGCRMPAGTLRDAATHRRCRMTWGQRAFPVSRAKRSGRPESQLSRVSQRLPGFLSGPDDERVFLESVVNKDWESQFGIRSLRRGCCATRHYCGWRVRIRQALRRRLPCSPC